MTEYFTWSAALALFGFFCHTSASSQPRGKIVIQFSSYTNSTILIKSRSNDSAVVRVLNSTGHSIDHLGAEDFVVRKDDDTGTIISCTPITNSSTDDIAITFVLDNSGSMFHSYDSLTRYLDAFVDSLPNGFVADAMTFDNRERKRTFDATSREELFIASSEFSGSRTALKAFWHSYDSIRTDLTPLYDCIIKGLERIIDRRRNGDSLKTEVMIVVTDGSDNASSIRIEKLQEFVRILPLRLFSVNFRSDPDGRLLWLAKKSKGDHFIANDLDSLREILEYLRRDISRAYQLKYYFPNRGANPGR